MAKTALGAAVVLVAFVGGIAAWAAFGRDSSAGGGDDAAEVVTNNPDAFTVAFGEAAADPEVGLPSAPPALPTDGGGASPQEAVDRFLRAEVENRFDDSFLFLSTADRQNHRSSARWTAAHREFPVFTGYQITPPAVAGDRVEVTTRVQLEPVLDEIVGLIPAQADAVWVTVREADTWRLSLADSVLTAAWPADTTAPAAVEDWVASRQECGADGPDATVAEWDGGLLGTPSLAAELCDQNGRPRIGAIDRLDPIDAAPFVAAFGEEVAELARVIHVQGPVELAAVVAPLGDQWLVVGTLPSPT